MFKEREELIRLVNYQHKSIKNLENDRLNSRKSSYRFNMIFLSIMILSFVIDLFFEDTTHVSDLIIHCQFGMVAGFLITKIIIQRQRIKYNDSKITDEDILNKPHIVKYLDTANIKIRLFKAEEEENYDLCVKLRDELNKRI